MSKRKTLGDFVPETQGDESQMIQRARELYAEKERQIVEVFLMTEAELKKTLKGRVDNPTKTIKHLKNPPRTIQKTHPLIVKTAQKMLFQFCPAALGNGGRCILRLTDVIPTLLPTRYEQVTNMATFDSQTFNSSNFVLHDLRITRSRNTCPFQLALRSNVLDMSFEALSRFKTGEKMMRAVSDQEPFVMQPLPSDAAYLEFEGNTEKTDYAVEKNGILVKPFGYIEPEATRVALSASDDINGNGIVWINWQDPSLLRTVRVGILSKEHVLTIAARTNFDDHFIKMVAFNKIGEKEDYFVVMPADLAKRVSDDFVERQCHAVPVCETSKAVFEVCRLVGGSDWMDKRARGDASEADMAKTYELELEFDISYTLENTETTGAVMNMPSEALPSTVIDTRVDLQEAIDRQVAEQIDEEMAMFDLAKMRLNDDDDE